MHTLIHVVIKGLIKLVLYNELHYLCVGRTAIHMDDNGGQLVIVAPNTVRIITGDSKH